METRKTLASLDDPVFRPIGAIPTLSTPRPVALTTRSPSTLHFRRGLGIRHGIVPTAAGGADASLGELGPREGDAVEHESVELRPLVSVRQQRAPACAQTTRPASATFS